MYSPVPTGNSESIEKVWRFILRGRSVTDMLASISALLSWLAGRLRGRAELELEVIAAINWPSCVASVPAAPGSSRSIVYFGSGSTGSGRGA